MWWKNKKLETLKKLSERRLNQIISLTNVVHNNMARIKVLEEKDDFSVKNTDKITRILEKQQDLIEDLQKEVIELKTMLKTFLN